MSKILDKLKAAEERRQRVIAERKPVAEESPASERAGQGRARLDQERARHATERREVESRAARAARPAAGERRPRLGMAAAIVLLLIAGFWSGMLYSERNLTSATEPKAAMNTEPETGKPPFRLRLDRDVDAFASRLKDGRRR